MGVDLSRKFAIEGWYEALSRELDPNWNIQVSVSSTLRIVTYPPDYYPYPA